MRPPAAGADDVVRSKGDDVRSKDKDDSEAGRIEGLPPKPKPTELRADVATFACRCVFVCERERMCVCVRVCVCV